MRVYIFCTINVDFNNYWFNAVFTISLFCSATFLRTKGLVAWMMFQLYMVTDQ